MVQVLPVLLGDPPEPGHHDVVQPQPVVVPEVAHERPLGLSQGGEGGQGASGRGAAEEEKIFYYLCKHARNRMTEGFGTSLVRKTVRTGSLTSQSCPDLPGSWVVRGGSTPTGLK